MIQLAGVHDPARRRRSSARPRSSSSTTSRPTSPAPSIDGNGSRVATPSLYDLLTPGPGAGEGRARRAPTTSSTPKKQAQGRPGGHAARSCSSTPRLAGQGAARAGRVLAVPEQHDRRSPARQRDRLPRARPDGCTAPTRLLPLQVPPGPTPINPIPEMTGRDLKLSGTQAGLRARRARATIVLLQFTSKGNKMFHDDHARRGEPRPGGGDSAGQGSASDSTRSPSSRSTSRSCSTARSSRRRRSTSSRTRTGSTRRTAAPRSPDIGELRRGEGPRARAADRRAAGQVRARSSAPTSRRRSARTRSARRRTRRSIGLLARRALPARPLPLPRPRRGDRARHLRGAPLRGDPALQRHADAAGLRRPDPHDRRRGRRERRHLRTHQGRGARREVRARRDRGRLREGLPHDHRRERRHRDHGARAVRGRDRAASRASR